MMKLASCNSSSDCLIKTSDGQSLQKLCFTKVFGSSDAFFCDCDPLIGLIGVDCTGHTLQSGYFVFSKLFLTISSILGFIYGAYLFFIILRLYSWPDDGNSGLNTLAAILICILISFFAEGIDGIFDVWSAFDPSSLHLITISFLNVQSEITTNGLRTSSFVVNLISLYSFALATSGVMLSWLQLLQSASLSFDRSTMNKIYFFINFTKISLISCTILVTILVCNEKYGIVSIIGALISFFILILINFARNLFLRALLTLNENTWKSNIVSKIKQFSFFYQAGSALFCFFLFYFPFTANLSLQYRAGEFNWFVNIFNIIYFIKTWLLFYSLLFLNRTVNNIIARLNAQSPVTL